MSEKPKAAEGLALQKWATEGPWLVRIDAEAGKAEAWGYWHKFGPFAMCVSDRKAIPVPQQANVDLTLWLRNNAEALLDALEENERLREALEACEDYFDQRADAEAVGDPPRFVGNSEMHHLGRIRRALGRSGE